MNKIWVYSLLFILILVGAYFYFHQIHRPALSPSVSGCDQNLWQHIYRPSRLMVIDPCKTVAGTIESIKREPDGDYHIRLKLDPQYNNLLDSKNLSQQRGNLVIEPVCVKSVSQRDAIAACKNYHSNLAIPPVGSHVTVTGSFVLDIEHGWNEIHPISKIFAQ